MQAIELAEMSHWPSSVPTQDDSAGMAERERRRLVGDRIDEDRSLFIILHPRRLPANTPRAWVLALATTVHLGVPRCLGVEPSIMTWFALHVVKLVIHGQDPTAH